jgi:hypothetical protein
MNTLRTLHDAFSALEERADATALHSDYTLPERPTRHRLAPPLAAAAAVLAVAAGVAAWQASRDGHPARQPAASGSTPAPTTSAPTSVAPRPHRFRPPATAAELATKARAILGDTATITVDPARSSDCGAVTMSLPAGSPGGYLPSPQVAGCSGAGIVGSLTSGGLTGGFDLDVATATPAEATNTEWPGAMVRHRPDGSTLVTRVWHDSAAPGGTTYEVEFIRSDRADILMHVSTERDPKGQSAVTASRVPLTLAQMEAFVTSHRW